MSSRRTRVFGTRGAIEGDGQRLTVHDFVTGRHETVETGDGEAVLDGDHGDADRALVKAFVAALAAGDPAPLLTDARASLDSHRLVWAAERARRTGTVVTIPEQAPEPDVPRSE
jgi:predicted dehydrogenase